MGIGLMGCPHGARIASWVFWEGCTNVAFRIHQLSGIARLGEFSNFPAISLGSLVGRAVIYVGCGTGAGGRGNFHVTRPIPPF